MLGILTTHHHYFDIFAVVWFLGLWFGYAYFADVSSSSDKGLVKAMHRYRLQWIKQMIQREDRFVDIRMVGNLLKTSTFLASTSVLIVGGFFAVLGFGERAVPIFSQLPFAVETPLYMWTVKTLFLLLIFIYSFFKLTWVIRQFNFIAVLILAAPLYVPGKETLEEVKKETQYVSRIAILLTNAARHFNMAVRAYYFGCVALSWYISPALMVLCAVLVVMVLYRREFKSKTFVQLM